MKALRLLLSLSVIIVTACSNPLSPSAVATIESLENDSLPFPEFLTIHEYYGFREECVAIDQTKIWELGNTIEELQNQIFESAVITVDDVIVLKGNQIIDSFSLTGAFLVDEDGNIIAGTGGPIEACIEKNGLSNGKHLATLEFESVSGVKYAYSWIFEVGGIE